MPSRPASICPCGHRVSHGDRCACQRKRDRERKALHDAKRPNAAQRGYDAEWQKERLAYLKINPHCRRCSAPATVVDHIQAHKGNKALFWNRSNWQPLCTTCHSGAKQAAEKGNRPPGRRLSGPRLTGGGDFAHDFAQTGFVNASGEVVQ